MTILNPQKSLFEDAALKVWDALKDEEVTEAQNTGVLVHSKSSSLKIYPKTDFDW